MFSVLRQTLSLYKPKLNSVTNEAVNSDTITIGSPSSLKCLVWRVYYSVAWNLSFLDIFNIEYEYSATGESWLYKMGYILFKKDDKYTKFKLFK